MQQKPTRFKYLDGLRGGACLAVVAYHYNHYFIVSQNFYGFYMDHPVLGVMSNGRLAVFIFFIISGFVLTKSSFAAPGGFGITLLARAIRLWLPSAAAMLIVFLAFYGMASPGHLDALRTGFIGIITGYSKTGLIEAAWVPPAANPGISPFWTISVELAGSALIFALAAARARSGIVYRVAVLAAVILLGDNELQLFMAGHFCARWQRFEASTPAVSAIATAGFLLTLAATTIWPASAFRYGRDIGCLPVSYDFNLALMLIAIFMFFCTAKSQFMIAALESRVMQFLGRISFPVYFLHMAVFVTFGAWLTARHTPPLIVAAACLVVIIILADLFERGIDAPAIALGQRVKNWNSCRRR